MDKTLFHTFVYAIPSHGLVSFFEEEDERTCVVRTTRLKDCPSVIPNIECGVKWSDGYVYMAKILAVGKCTCILYSLSTKLTSYLP